MQLKKNIVFNIIYQVVQLLLPLVVTPYVARVLSPNGVGLYSFSNSIVTYFGLFILLGVANYGNRSIAEVSNDKYNRSKVFFEIYFFQVMMGIVVLCSYFIFSLLQDNFLIYFVQIFYLIGLILDFNWFFSGIERFDITVTRSLIIRFLSVLLIFLFVKNQNDIYTYALIMTLGPLLGQIILLPFLFKQVTFVKPNKNSIIKHIKPNLVLFVPILATSFFTQVDKIMIGGLIDTTQVAYYDYSEKIIKIPIGVITAYNTVMMPRMVNIINYEKEKYLGMLRKSMEIVGFFSIGIFFGLIAVSNDFINIFYGNDYKACIQLTKLFSLYCIIVPWSHTVRMQYLIPNKKDKNYVSSIVLGAIVNFILNSILIRIVGTSGAIIATLITELVILLYQQKGLFKILDTKQNLIKWFFYFIPGIIMYLVICSLSELVNLSPVINLIFEIMVGGFIYVLLNVFLYFLKKKIVSSN